MSDAEQELESYGADFERAYRAAEGALDHWLEDARAQLVRPPIMECSFLFIDDCYHVVVHVAASKREGLFGGNLHVRVDRTFAVVECRENVHLVGAHQDPIVSDEREAELGVITDLVDAGSVVQLGVLTSHGEFVWLRADGNLFRRAEAEYVETHGGLESLLGARIAFERTDWGGLAGFTVEEDA